MKTKMGHAPGIAYGIDQLKIQDVLGTVGGDDTLVVILKEGADGEAPEGNHGLPVNAPPRSPVPRRKPGKPRRIARKRMP